MSAAVWISHDFGDGERLTVQAETDDIPHPDLLDQLEARCVAAYREALAIGRTTVGDGEGD